MHVAAGSQDPAGDRARDEQMAGWQDGPSATFTVSQGEAEQLADTLAAPQNAPASQLCSPGGSSRAPNSSEGESASKDEGMEEAGEQDEPPEETAQHQSQAVAHSAPAAAIFDCATSQEAPIPAAVAGPAVSMQAISAAAAANAGPAVLPWPIPGMQPAVLPVLSGGQQQPALHAHSWPSRQGDSPTKESRGLTQLANGILAAAAAGGAAPAAGPAVPPQPPAIAVAAPSPSVQTVVASSGTGTAGAPQPPPARRHASFRFHLCIT